VTKRISIPPPLASSTTPVFEAKKAIGDRTAAASIKRFESWKPSVNTVQRCLCEGTCLAGPSGSDDDRAACGTAVRLLGH
jgi:hypothetical protein